jgi:hypothetical protein
MAMTAPLHHLNQMYLHLPAINGQVALHAAVSEELQQLSRQAQDQAYRRDIVEVVSETEASQPTNSVHREYEPLVKANAKNRTRAKESVLEKAAKRPQNSDPDLDLLVDVRV